MSFLWSSKIPSAFTGWQQFPHHFLEQLRAMSSATQLYLCLLASAVILVLYINLVYGPWFDKKYDKLDKNLEEKERKTQCKEMTLELVRKQLDIAKAEEGTMHNALYQSEARRRAKTKRRSRPKRVGSRSPELLPNITAERCRADGLAILEITDDDEEKRSEVSWRSRRSRRDEKSARKCLGSEREASLGNESVTLSCPGSPGGEAESMWENASLESCIGTVPWNPAVTHL